MPSSAQRATKRSRSCGPARVRSATRSPSLAAAAAAYTAVPPMRQSASPSNSSRAACPIVTRSNIEKDVHDLAVLDGIGLAFRPHDPLPLRIGFATCFQQLVPLDDLGSDKASLEVRMDGAGGLLCWSAARNGPCADLVLAGPEERTESKQLVRRPDQTIERRLGEPDLLPERRRFVGRKLGDLGLDLGADRYDRARAVRASCCAHRAEHVLWRGDVGLVEIDSDQHGHPREKSEAADRLLLLRVEIQIAERSLGVECGDRLLQHRLLALLCLPLDPFRAP